MGDVLEVRKVLLDLPRKEGMLWLIGDLARKNRFGAIRSWIEAPPSDEVRLVRYEDLTGERQAEESDWQNHFDDDIYEAFAQATGDLVQRLGYPSYQEK
jgi:hypothetical protein